MQQTPPQPAPIKTRRWNVSLVWIVPIVALLVVQALQRVIAQSAALV